MAKNKLLPTTLTCPISGAEIERRMHHKLDILEQFCFENDIPHEDEEYNIDNLVFNTFCDVVIDTYGDLMDETAVSVFEKKGFLMVDGQPVDDVAEGRIYVFEMEPGKPLKTGFSDTVIMKIHDPDVAMLVKLALP